jgi:hypothetical protein
MSDPRLSSGVHRAVLLGTVHLSRLKGRGSLRLEANGLFTLRARGNRGVRVLEPGLYRVVLWPRTDREGFVTQVVVAQAQLLSPAPVGTTPLKPLVFHLLGRWLGTWDGIGLVEVVPKDPLEVRPFAVRFLVKSPEEAPSPGGVVRVKGRVERGRLIGVPCPA